MVPVAEEFTTAGSWGAAGRAPAGGEKATTPARHRLATDGVVGRSRDRIDSLAAGIAIAIAIEA